GVDAGGEQRDGDTPDDARASGECRLVCRSEARCGRPGLSQPSLRAFTYRYSSAIADVSSSTFQAGMPLARRPFKAVLTKLSRGKLAPLGLRAQRRSGAAGLIPPMASSPWQR